jgi:hypothetical protein
MSGTPEEHFLVAACDAARRHSDHCLTPLQADGLLQDPLQTGQNTGLGVPYHQTYDYEPGVGG